jgi:hypothetical protein
LAASTADPKKVEKVDFDFCHFFLRFLCQAPRCGSEVSNGHRSEVNIIIKDPVVRHAAKDPA